MTYEEIGEQLKPSTAVVNTVTIMGKCEEEDEIMQGFDVTIVVNGIEKPFHNFRLQLDAGNQPTSLYVNEAKS